MSESTDYLGTLDQDDPRTPSQQIANKLRAAILTRKLQPGDKLPSQNDLAQRYGVARETVKAAMRLLDQDRLIVSRQGSGAYVRAQTERPVGLRPHFEAAFDQPHVSIDFAGFSGETLHNTLAEVLDKVRAGRLTPQAINIRMMTADTSAPMFLPRRVDTGASTAEPAIQKRAARIGQRAIEGIVDSLNELADLGLVKSATAEVRFYPMTPWFKLYLLNADEAFLGFYPIIEHTINVGSDSVNIWDLMGKDATLFHFSKSDAEMSNGPQLVSQAQQWFDSVWGSIAREQVRESQ